NLKLLTALRRAEGRPDPLTIHLTLDGPQRFMSKFREPIVKATIENVDPGREAVNLHQGSDSNGERWRFALTDEQDRRVADSNFISLTMGGGLGSMGPFQYGEKSTWYYA